MSGARGESDRVERALQVRRRERYAWGAFPRLARRKDGELKRVALSAAVAAFERGLAREDARPYFSDVFSRQMERMLAGATAAEVADCLSRLVGSSCAFFNGLLDGLVKGKSEKELLQNACLVQAVVEDLELSAFDDATERAVLVVTVVVGAALRCALRLPVALVQLARGVSGREALRDLVRPYRGPLSGYWLFRFRGDRFDDSAAREVKWGAPERGDGANGWLG